MNALLRILLAFGAALVFSVPASAQIFRAYVKSTGSDGNNCTLPAPCRLLPAALTAVADGGEIWMLDSANYNVAQVEVTKSVTILAIPGAVGSVVATGGGHAFHVNTAGVKLTLRNLVIVHLASSADGINFAQGFSLNIEGSEIANVQGNGVNATAGNVTISDTVIRDVGVGGVAMGPSGGSAALKRVHITGATQYGVSVSFSARATISESVISGNGTGLSVLSGVSSPLLVVERSTISGNGIGVQLIQPQAPNLNAGFFGNVFSRNVTTMSIGAQNPGLLVVLDGNSMVGPVNFSVTGTPTINTRGNNFMTSSVGATLTPLAPR